MAYGVTDIAGYSGVDKGIAADVIGSSPATHFQRVKGVWGPEGAVYEHTDTTPPPVATGLRTVTGYGNDTIPTTTGGVALPGIGGITATGTIAVLTVESGAVRVGINTLANPTATAGQLLVAGQSKEMPYGTQLADVRIIGGDSAANVAVTGTATVSVEYTQSGQA